MSLMRTLHLRQYQILRSRVRTSASWLAHLNGNGGASRHGVLGVGLDGSVDVVVVLCLKRQLSRHAVTARFRITVEKGDADDVQSKSNRADY